MPVPKASLKSKRRRFRSLETSALRLTSRLKIELVLAAGHHAARELEHVVHHSGREAPGVRVLPARVVAPDQTASVWKDVAHDVPELCTRSKHEAATFQHEQIGV